MATGQKPQRRYTLSTTDTVGKGFDPSWLGLGFWMFLEEFSFLALLSRPFGEILVVNFGRLSLGPDAVSAGAKLFVFFWGGKNGKMK